MTIIKKIPIRTFSYSLLKTYRKTLPRGYCSATITTTSPENSSSSENVTKSGFAKAYERHSNPLEEQSKEISQSFASLLRNSKFIDLGDPEGKIVTGTVYHVVGDDLYIDFGWKFHCVCQRPNRSGSDYVRGSKVRLRIKDLELSTQFLGSNKDLTILEADCQLLGLIYSPARGTKSETRLDQQLNEL